jgi:hypothetical protein
VRMMAGFIPEANRGLEEIIDDASVLKEEQ